MQERELRVGIGDMKFTRGTGKIIIFPDDAANIILSNRGLYP